MLFHPHYEYIICGGGTTDVEHHSVVGIGYLVGTCLGCYLFVKVEESGSEYLSLCPPPKKGIYLKYSNKKIGKEFNMATESPTSTYFSFWAANSLP